MPNYKIKCLLRGMETIWIEVIDGDEEAGIGRVKKHPNSTQEHINSFVEYWKDDDWIPKARIISVG